MVGIVVQGHRIGAGETLHLVRIEIQQIGLLVVLRLPPFRQIGHAGDGVGDDGVVEVEQILVTDGLRHLAGAARIIGCILEDVPVPGDEIIIGEPLLDVALHQTLPDEEIARLKRIDAPPLHGAVLHDRAGRTGAPSALATAEPREPDQCGSAYVVRVSAPASGSAHAGSICAEYRAHSRLVSTSSVLITHCGVDLATAEAGNRAKCVPRAP